MEVVVVSDPEAAAEHIFDQPVGDRMAVEGRRGVRSRGTAGNTDLVQDSANIRLGQGRSHAGTTDLGHCRNHKVRVDVLDPNAFGRQFGTDGLGPARKKGLGSRIN